MHSSSTICIWDIQIHILWWCDDGKTSFPAATQRFAILFLFHFFLGCFVSSLASFGWCSRSLIFLLGSWYVSLSPPTNLCAFGCTIVWFVWLLLPICADLGSLEMPVTHCAQLCHGWSCYLGGVFYFQFILFSCSFWFLHLEYMILGSRGSPTKKKQTNKQRSSSWFSYFPILFLRLQCHLLFSSVPRGLTLGSWNPSLSYVNCVLVTGSKSAIGEFSHLLQQYISNLSPHWVVVSI